MYTTIRSGSGAAVVSTIKSATEMPESVERLISHPRSIGLVATPFESIAGYQPDQMIGGAGRVDETIVIEQGEYDGIPCDIWVRRGPNYEVRGWISRGEGAPVLKVETRGVSESMVQTRTIETKYENRAGVTIPVSYEFACVNNGVVVETEKGTVEYVSLNSGLERNVFDLSGIGVAEGTVFAVYRRDQSGDFVWDGAKLVPREVPTFNQPTPLVPRSRGQSWIVLFAVNSALFAAFAVFFFWGAVDAWAKVALTLSRASQHSGDFYQSPTPSGTSRGLRSPKRSCSRSQTSGTVPIGPLRFLATMRSASPGRSSGS